MKTSNKQVTDPGALEKELTLAANEINSGKSPDLKHTSTLLNSAARAIAQLAQDADAFASTYGDNWFDGFNAAKELEKKTNSCISDLTDDEILAMSEHAETDKLNTNRKKENKVQHLFAELYQVLGCHNANNLALDITRDATTGIYRTNELLPYEADKTSTQPASEEIDMLKRQVKDLKRQLYTLEREAETVDYEYPQELFLNLITQNSRYAFYIFQWIPYQEKNEANRWRLKLQHDIKTFSGEIHLNAYPNGTSFDNVDDDEIEFIRVSKAQYEATWNDTRND